MKRVSGFYVSEKTKMRERYDSSYELRRFQALDASPLVKSWTRRHRIRIPYVMGKKRHYYTPDIMVVYEDGRKILEEVKGFVFDKEQFELKNVAAGHWCKIQGMTFRIIWEPDLPVVS